MVFPRWRGRSVGSLWIAFLTGVAGLGSVSPASAVSGQPPLAAAFHAAALRYQVPEDLLSAMGYVNTHWEMQHSADDGWGVMHIVKRNKVDAVAAAAQLTGHTEQQLEQDPASNIDGGAALLAHEQGGIQAPSLNGWWPAVSRVGGGEIFARQVFATLRSGASRIMSSGESVSLPAHAEVVVPSPAPKAASSAAAAPQATAASATSPTPGDYPGATWIAASSSNYSVFDRPISFPVNLIVIHMTEGSYAGAISTFQDPTAAASAHFVTRSADGFITQMVREQDVAWHAGNWDYNTRAIGIEHEGFVNDPSWFTDTMYRSSAKLTAFIAVKYGIPIDRGHIIGHYQVPDPNNPGQFGGAGHHTDPGPLWNWGLYLSYVQQDAAGISCASDWMLYPGLGRDVAVGANGAAWLIGTNPVAGGFGIFHWNGGAWANIAGGGVRIAVDPGGLPWIVNSERRIFRTTGSGWQLMPGLAFDIGVGSDGSVLIVGTNPVPGGYSLFRWNGSAWSLLPGGAIQVAAGPSGAAWIVNDGGTIFQLVGGAWQLRPGQATNVGIGADGSVWTIGVNPVPGGYRAYRWNGAGWDALLGGAVDVGVGPDGAPWVVSSANLIFVGRPGAWHYGPGSGHDIAVGANGSVWITGTNPVDGGYGIYHWDGTSWVGVDGGGVNIAVDPSGTPWLVNASNLIFRRIGSTWVSVPGSASDIGIGADGSVWIIGVTGASGGYTISKWNGSGWSAIDGGGVSIAVDPGGLPWVVNSSGVLLKRTAGGTWQSLPGSAHDVEIGPDGTTWITGTNPSCGGFGVYRWNGTGWDQYDGAGFQIAVGPGGHPWLIDGPGDILSRT
jgi:hypothetical protein